MPVTRIKMKYLILQKPSVCLKFYRRLSIDLWKQEFSREVSKNIEAYWSKKFQYENLFNKKDLKNKVYVLSMFPYPSGNLHMGHVRVYTLSDTMARFYRLNGKNVFHPMGWDSFGLPAENAAIERGIAPSEWTQQNIAQMKAQLKKLGCTFDWKHEIVTSSPDYYRWTQYIFLKMYEADLVYQKEALVNWDPVDRTVLADEQVDEENRSWRSGAKVEKKFLNQWFIKTTKFAKELRDGLNDENLLHWKDIIDIQKNWIDKCNGYSFDFRLEKSTIKSINIWIKKPLSVLKAGFIFVKPNSLVDIISEDGRCGTERKLRITSINPFTGYSLPIYVRKDVPYPVGRDVYLGLPEESETDAEFARNERLPSCSDCALYTEELMLEVAKKINIGGYPVSSKLKDWLISRQRYWGTPIPIVHCSNCGTVPVPYKQLPVVLPPLPKNIPLRTGLNTFLKNSDWVKTKCPWCYGEATRETDTMDTFVDSSWYFLRYTDVDNKREPFSTKVANQLMPVDLYVGGLEHAVLHLYYSRFMNYFLNVIEMLDHREPFRSLFVHGIIKGKTYKTTDGKYLKSDQVEVKDNKAISKETGEELVTTWKKMSKSRHNGVEPNDILDEYGIDTTRLFLLFSVAPRSTRNWDDRLFPDVLKWQHRLWLTIREFIKVRENPLESTRSSIDMEKEDEKLRDSRNYYIKSASYHFTATQQLASSIAELQGFTNILRKAPVELRKYSKEYERALAAFIIMLAPLAPHFSATLWYGFTHAPSRLNVHSNEIQWDEDVTKQRWPRLDSDYEVPIIYRINMRKNYNIKIPNPLVKSLTLEQAIEYGMRHPTVKKILTSNIVKNMKLTTNEPYNALLYIVIPEEVVNVLNDEKNVNDESGDRKNKRQRLTK